jgi:hypothetical protein
MPPAGAAGRSGGQEEPERPPVGRNFPPPPPRAYEEPPIQLTQPIVTIQPPYAPPEEARPAYEEEDPAEYAAEEAPADTEGEAADEAAEEETADDEGGQPEKKAEAAAPSEEYSGGRRKGKDRRSGEDRRRDKEGDFVFDRRSGRDRRRGGRRKIDDPEKKKNEERARMREYLVNLAAALPEDKYREFERSEIKLKIEMLKAELRGGMGLKRRIERYRPKFPVKQKEQVGVKKVAETLRFMEDISSFLPDKELGSALKIKVEGLMNKLTNQKERD